MRALLSSAFALLVLCSSMRGEHSPRLTEFAFRDQLGKNEPRRDLVGHVWIADFMYTSCRSACPLTTSRLVALQHRLSDPSLRFVSFSVDPETDTPEALARYAARWNPAEKRWLLLSTDDTGLTDLTSQLRLELARDRGELLHTNRFFLIDSRGAVVGDYDSADDAALARLDTDATRLLGAPSLAPVSDDGRELFSSLGCAGCHSDSQIAPPLAGLFGSNVMFERGAPVIANDDYLRESIAEPAAKIVAGYPDSMPAYGALLSPAQIEVLVSQLKSLPSAAPSAALEADNAAPETDPVCGMPTRVGAQTPSESYRGHDYHFCSMSCQRRFRADPSKYLPNEAQATR